MNYGTFGNRFAAYIIDSVIIIIISLVIDILLVITNSYSETISFVVILLLSFVYFSYLTYKFGATFGKMLLGLQVTNLDNKHVSLLQSAGRYLSTWVSSIILCIGYLFILWQPKKQALHDIMAKTYVTQKKSKSSKSLIIVAAILFALFCGNVLLGAIGGGVAGATVGSEMDINQAHESVQEICGSLWLSAKDTCIYMLNVDQISTLTPIDEQISICDDIIYFVNYGNCLGVVATRMNNPKICEKSKNKLGALICSNQYEDVTYEIPSDYTESLNANTTKLGLIVNDYCVNYGDTKFAKHQTMCVYHDTVGKFKEVNSQSKTTSMIKVKDSNNNVVIQTTNVEELASIQQFENNSFTGYPFTLSTDFLPDGNYVVEYYFIDLYGKQYLTDDYSFTVEDNYEPPKIVPNSVIFGEYNEVTGECKQTSTLSKNTPYCFEINVSNITSNFDGRNWYNIDVILSKNNKIINEDYGIVEKNYFELENNNYFDSFYSDFGLTEIGEYEFKLTFYDFVGNREMTEVIQFNVE